jgi:hypothetical protein
MRAKPDPKPRANTWAGCDNIKAGVGRAAKLLALAPVGYKVSGAGMTKK